MDQRDELFRDKLTEKQKKNIFYLRATMAVFNRVKEPKVTEKIIEEAERLGFTSKEVGELEKSLDGSMEVKNWEAVCNHLKVAKAQMKMKELLKEQEKK